MKNSFSKLLALACAVLLIPFCSCDRPQEREIVIISTNDIHSAIDLFPNLATLVESYREQYPDRLLLVDAGDRWTGNPYVDLAAEKGKPVIDLMNELGFDIATFGNHEYDNGIELLAERTREADFIKILANADMTDTAMEPVAPYHIFNIDGIRVAFYGLITNAVNGHLDGKDESFGNSVFYDPIDTSLALTGLRDGSEVLIALTHTGLDKDIELANSLGTLDLIIGGHSHDTLHYGREVNGVLITQAGKSLKYAGVTTIRVRGDKVAGIDNRLVMLDTVARMPHFEKLVDEINSNPELKKPVGYTAHNMNKIALMNLFSDIMREGTGAQFAFYNMGSMRIERLPAGGISIGDIFAAEPFSNTPEIIEMTLEEIADLILNKFNSEGKESHTVDIYPSGMTYTIITDGQGNGTDVIFTHNYYPEHGKLYRVVMLDYMASQYDFPKKNTGKSTNELITDMTVSYLKNHNPVRVINTNRVNIE